MMKQTLVATRALRDVITIHEAIYQQVTSFPFIFAPYSAISQYKIRIFIFLIKVYSAEKYFFLKEEDKMEEKTPKVKTARDYFYEALSQMAGSSSTSGAQPQRKSIPSHLERKLDFVTYSIAKLRDAPPIDLTRTHAKLIEGDADDIAKKLRGLFFELFNSQCYHFKFPSFFLSWIPISTDVLRVQCLFYENPYAAICFKDAIGCALSEYFKVQDKNEFMLQGNELKNDAAYQKEYTCSKPLNQWEYEKVKEIFIKEYLIRYGAHVLSTDSAPYSEQIDPQNKLFTKIKEESLRGDYAEHSPMAKIKNKINQILCGNSKVALTEEDYRLLSLYEKNRLASYIASCPGVAMFLKWPKAQEIQRFWAIPVKEKPRGVAESFNANQQGIDSTANASYTFVAMNDSRSNHREGNFWNTDDLRTNFKISLEQRLISADESLNTAFAELPVLDFKQQATRKLVAYLNGKQNIQLTAEESKALNDDPSIRDALSKIYVKMVAVEVSLVESTERTLQN